MKKRIKNAGSFKRFYASGIPMYRERNNPFAVAAGTLASVILVKNHTAIVEVKCTKEQKAALEQDSVVLSIPLDNFLGDKLTKAKAAKAATRKVKAVAAEATVAAEVAPAATVEVPAENAAPAPEVAPEVAPEPAPAVAEAVVNAEPAVETAV